MKRPIGLPEEFVPTCEGAKEGKELFKKVVTLSDQKIYDFFDCACDDHTWIQEHGGGEFLSSMLSWFSEKAKQRSYPLQLLEKVCASCLANHKVVIPLLPKDILFVVEGKKFRCNSLMFHIRGGDFFRNIEDEETDLPFTSSEVFKKIREFIYTGNVEGLWKDEPQNIYAVIEQANQWDLRELSDLGFQTYRNYIEKETLMKRLTFALKDKLPVLANEMCQVINKEHMGFTLEFDRFDQFSIEVKRVWDEYEPFLLAIAPYITHIACHNLHDNFETLIQFFPKCKELHGIDFSKAPAVEIHRLTRLLDEVKHLSITYCNLSDLEWVDDACLREILNYLPQLVELNLTRVSHLSYQGYAEFAALKCLDNLNLSYHVRMSDDDLGIVIETLPDLRILNLSECQKLTDVALNSELQRLHRLEELSLSYCKGFSQAALHSLKGLTHLKRVFLTETKGADQGFAKLLKQHSPVLQEVIL